MKDYGDVYIAHEVQERDLTPEEEQWIDSFVSASGGELIQIMINFSGDPYIGIEKDGGMYHAYYPETPGEAKFIPS